MQRFSLVHSDSRRCFSLVMGGRAQKDEGNIGANEKHLALSCLRPHACRIKAWRYGTPRSHPIPKGKLLACVFSQGP